MLAASEILPTIAERAGPPYGGALLGAPGPTVQMVGSRRCALPLGAFGTGWLGANLTIAAVTCHPLALGRAARMGRVVKERVAGGPAFRRRLRPETQRAQTLVTPAELAERYVQVDYGPARRGWWSPGNASRLPVVLAHGYCTSANAVGSDAAPVLDVAADLRAAGHPVLAMTFGYATGAYPFGAGWREAEDVRTACAWVLSETGAPALAWGFSAGAHAAVLAASVPGPFSAVVSDSPVVHLVDVVRSECARRSHLPRAAFGPLRWAIPLMAGARPVDLSRHRTADVYPVPVLVVRAGRDDIISPAAAEVVRRATGGQAWEVAGAAHAQAYRVAPSAYFTRVQRLLAEVDGNPSLTRPAP